MPKNRKTIKHDGVTKKINVASKNRIGTRESGTSASLMSVEQLRTIATEKGKRGHKARAELQKRGKELV